MTDQPPGIILYLAEEDLYRLGNATSPKFDHIRDPQDVDTYERNGILMVLANGRGISLITEFRLAHQRPGSWLWKLPAGAALPLGLLFNNDRPGHYALCPAFDMTVDEYRALLSRLAVNCERIRKT